MSGEHIFCCQCGRDTLAIRPPDLAGRQIWCAACGRADASKRAASVTLTEGGDAKQAPGASLSGAVPEGQTPKGGSHA